jgi:EAL domain-containing protein (putative c-di-GMP-specific phosphodiesterase class I)
MVVTALPLARSTATAVLSMVFQPIVDLRSEGVVGYEALARGPAGSPWERPDDLFAQARLEGRLREMDWACRVAAMRDARACSSDRPAWRLFVNTEPEVLGTICPEELLSDWVGGTGELDIVVEVTERALVHGPRRLLAAVEELRALGCEIALDDVGANEASVALLPLIEPDVVKLDAPLLSASDEAALTSLRAVTSYVERSGAVVVAEGIETELDRARAVALGAGWGQGYLFARPRALHARDVAGYRPAAAPSPLRRPPVGRRPDDMPRLLVSPEWVTGHLRWVAESATHGAATNVLLIRLPDAGVAPVDFAERLTALHETCALTLFVLGEGGRVATEGFAGDGGEEIVGVLLGPSVSHSVVASRTGDGRYEVLLDDRPDAVASAARHFLRHLH